MLEPIQVTISDGYHLCGVCGKEMYNGDKALVLAETYCHPRCAIKNVPDAWKVARRIDTYMSSNPDPDSPDYWENQLLPFENYQRESQVPKSKKKKNSDEEIEPELIEHTGQRWNGQPLADCREAINNASIYCDIPKVSRLMVELTELQILAEERANLYTTWTPLALAADKAIIRPPFVEVNDMRTCVGLDVTPDGHVIDNLPTEDEPEPEGESE